MSCQPIGGSSYSSQLSVDCLVEQRCYEDDYADQAQYSLYRGAEEIPNQYPARGPGDPLPVRAPEAGASLCAFSGRTLTLAPEVFPREDADDGAGE